MLTRNQKKIEAKNKRIARSKLPNNVKMGRKLNRRRNVLKPEQLISEQKTKILQTKLDYTSIKTQNQTALQSQLNNKVSVEVMFDKNKATSTLTNMKIRVKKDICKKLVKRKEDDGEKLDLYFCKICTKFYESERLLNHHLRTIHRPLTVIIKQGAFCDKCRCIVDETIIEDHAPCFKGGKFISFGRSNRKVKKLKQISYGYTSTKCRICQAQHKSRKELSSHLETAHIPIISDIEKENKTKFCDACQLHFMEDLFADHFPCKAVDIKCFFCLTVMPTKAHFSEHKLTWESWRSFQCNLCEINTKAMTFAELNVHMRNHNKQGVYRCVRCRLFLEKSTLKLHIDYYHKGCRCLSEKCHCDTYSEYYYISKILQASDAEEIISSRAYYNKHTDLNETKSVTCNNNSNKNSEINDFDNNPCSATENVSSITNPINVYSRMQSLQSVSTISDATNIQKTTIKSAIADDELNDHQLLENDEESEIVSFDEIEYSEQSQNTLVDYIKCEPEEVENTLNEPSQEPKEVEKRSKIRKKPRSTCIVCGFNFRDSLSVAEHALRFHRPWAVRMMEDIYCHRCKAWFASEALYLVHHPCQRFPIRDKCHICQMNHPFKEHFLLHNIAFFSPNRLCCTLCENNSIEYTLSALNKHRKNEHSKRGVYECLKCNLTFTNLIESKRHLIKCDSNVETESFAETFHLQFNNETRPNHFKCHICNKIYFSQHVLQRHMVSHRRKQDKNLCFICGLTFINPPRLREHQNVAHYKNITYNCKSCDKKFLSKKYLTQHEKIHKNTKEFNCELCSKIFIQQTSLIYHMACHTGENVFKCSVCERPFNKQSILTSHMEIHNADGTNPHNCKLCNKFFSHKCNLLVHMRTHSDANKE